IGGNQNDKQGLEEASLLLENAKLFAPNRYEIEFVESILCNAYGDVAGLETVLNNLQRFPQSSTASNYAQAQKDDLAFPQDFWAMMTPEQLEQTQDIRLNYLRVSQP
ncbi:MAG: hypothetical protein KJ043_17250, partial [Anaerolineae bacterium]|nr:hypothetical protein [Anaerolineae bacterium]